MSEQNHHMTNGELVRGGIGSMVALVAWAVSLANVEIAMRLASLGVGLTVGVCTLHGMWRKGRNRNKKK